MKLFYEQIKWWWWQSCAEILW